MGLVARLAPESFHGGVAGCVFYLRGVLVIHSAHVDVACLTFAEQVYHFVNVQVLVAIVHSTGSLLGLGVELGVVLGSRLVANVNVRVLGQQLRMLVNLWRFLVDILNIYQVFGHILTVLEILFEKLIVVLRRLQGCLLVRQLIW